MLQFLHFSRIVFRLNEISKLKYSHEGMPQMMAVNPHTPIMQPILAQPQRQQSYLNASASEFVSNTTTSTAHYGEPDHPPREDIDWTKKHPMDFEGSMPLPNLQ